jgi:hypothetical protein
MPYVRRSAQGEVVALLAVAEYEGQEHLPADHPQVQAFVGGNAADAAFNALDSDFVRVTEDLIDVLIEKGVLRLTDLPIEAQRKLSARQRLRRRLTGALDLLDDNNDLI